ncbi:MAG: homoserine dehydrogenase [Candidatus Omnitrophota bacterium]
MNKINIGLIGCGEIGSGVVKILNERKTLLKQKIGVELVLKKICDKNLNYKRRVKINLGLLTKNVREILDDPQIDIVVELIGGINPAKDFIIEALKKSKYVVTANKALLATFGKELFDAARTANKNIYFEASVAGGIPVIKSIKEGLVANRFLGIYGIVNGTCNYILSKMSQDGLSFAESLKEAKKKGFAEKNPRLDLEGIDSAHKLILLTYLAFGRLIPLEHIRVEGITHISLSDIRYADELNLAIKLLAIAKKEGNKLDVRVHPTLIHKKHLLASVKWEYNAIYVSSDLAGKQLFYGKGAGQLPTASAVVSDLVDLAKDIKAGLFRPTLEINPDTSVKLLQDKDNIESRYYIRFVAVDKPGVLAQIAGILAKFNISIASVTQKEKDRAKVVPVVMITHEVKEGLMRRALERIDNLALVKGKTVAIRMEDL